MAIEYKKGWEFKLMHKYQNTKIGKGVKNINQTDQATS